MLLKTRNDTDALIDSLGKTELQYIDIQRQAAVEQALYRWPLLTKLRQEWAEDGRRVTA